MKLEYIKGSGKADKASILVGKTQIPASVISRLQVATEGKSAQRVANMVFAALQTKYSSVLDELDKAGLDYAEALAKMVALKPVKAPKTGHRASKGVVLATSVSKVIARRFKGTSEEMVMAFLEAVSKEEFSTEVISMLESYQKTYGTNPLGFIKVNERKANPKALKALKAWRQQHQ